MAPVEAATMRSYRLYRLLFFGCVLLSMLLVSVTVATRNAPRRWLRRRAACRHHPAARPQLAPVSPANAEPSTLSSRKVRITAVVPYRREIELVQLRRGRG
jgi:hypothetical protein